MPSMPSAHAANPTLAVPAPARRAAVRRRLLTWYRRNARRLPWRADPTRSEDDGAVDPYHVLVSEAMLQQTQVTTVIDYFHRFIEAFPTLADLAAADEQRVLSLWQGLGYYRRARHLHRAAREVVQRRGGRIPMTAAELTALPGIGRYTAGAIASIAFQQREPVLDGNVARVLARLEGIGTIIDETSTQHHLWQLAALLLPKKRPGDFNQALMELGATTCTPRTPACEHCPLRGLCRARADGLTTLLPRRRGRKPPQPVTHHIVAIERGGRYLFEQRPDDGLWAGMWQLPVHEALDEAAEPDALASWVHERFGLEITLPAAMHRFTHVTTHRMIAFHLWRATCHRGRLRPATGLWRHLNDLAGLPLANAQHRAIEYLRNNASGPRRQRPG